MSTYSVADAKNGLPRLIDRALDGEEVIIARHGKPVVELRPATTPPRKTPPATYAWLKARRQTRPPVGLSSMELLEQLYEDPEA
ncbi:type II toxin-antitoxin system prevent-host-death family antitoxin [Caulobacter sp. BK020]|uniref:type II toxin-antitoxin system Phd/YefM family antitoxin n=1 Tax=Caulobacter sp. BK020 TaxID=2512117 RepID=UPI0010E55829|nr:type II toxin-antitoxin system prevent-host-death family antitoxin [Caulobacter sp. BK020]TCS15525.1 prevent-host-death family protein [Caulobacter sp. BK020]